MRASSALLRKIFEWLWRSEALARARAVTRLDLQERRMLNHAWYAKQAGDRLLAAVEPIDPADGVRFALGLYQWGLYWSLRLLFKSELGDRCDLTSVSECLEAQQVAAVGIAEEDIEVLRKIVREPDFVGHFALSDAEARSRAECAQNALAKLTYYLKDREPSVGMLYKQRALRVVGSLILVTVIGYGLLLEVDRWRVETTDIGRGKHWTASSAYRDSSLTGTLEVKQPYLFHTLEEKNPWVMVDLGVSEKVGGVLIVNRQDCCFGRAVPLVVELSDDRLVWRTVARRDQLFNTWRKHFPVQSARYLRIRALRVTMLHFETIKILRG